jgi:Sec-independent protein translocase protein TatA
MFFDLTPVKILLVLVVAVVLVGPQKLPQVARQIGAGWRRLQAFREQVDRDIREHVPDLPSSQEIARYARSPAALLEHLARIDEPLVEDPGAAPAASGEAWPEDTGVTSAPAGARDAGVLPAPAAGEPGEPALPPAPDDPSLN